MAWDPEDLVGRRRPHRGGPQRLRARQHQVARDRQAARPGPQQRQHLPHLLGQLPGADVQPERIDVGAMHDTSSNTSRLTVPLGREGSTPSAASIEFAANSTGRRGIQIRLNGTTVTPARRPTTSAARNDHPCTIYTEYQLAAGDYVELMGLLGLRRVAQHAGHLGLRPRFFAHWISTSRCPGAPWYTHRWASVPRGHTRGAERADRTPTAPPPRPPSP